MSAHTPGPWTVAGLPHGTVVRTQSLGKSKFGADRYAAIGGFDRSDPEQLAEAMANARLIAAAPELLALLKRYRAETPLGHQPHMLAHEADAAIANATEVKK